MCTERSSTEGGEHSLGGARTRKLEGVPWGHEVGCTTSVKAHLGLFWSPSQGLGQVLWPPITLGPEKQNHVRHFSLSCSTLSGLTSAKNMDGLLKMTFPRRSLPHDPGNVSTAPPSVSKLPRMKCHTHIIDIIASISDITQVLTLRHFNFSAECNSQNNSILVPYFSNMTAYSAVVTPQGAQRVGSLK